MNLDENLLRDLQQLPVDLATDREGAMAKWRARMPEIVPGMIRDALLEFQRGQEQVAVLLVRTLLEIAFLVGCEEAQIAVWYREGLLFAEAETACTAEGGEA
jgi:hypothetical protein